MPPKPASPKPDGGLRFLEEKLSIYVQGPSQTRRNHALDILTGRIPDERLASAAPAPPDPLLTIPQPARRPRTLVLPIVPVRLAPATAGLGSSPSPWLRPVAQPLPRMRLVIPPPPPRSVWLTIRPLLAPGLAAVLMLAAGIAGRSLYEHLAAPAPVIAKQTASVAQSPTQVASSPLPATTLSELPLTPAPPIPADQFRVLLDERFTASSTARDWPSDPHGMSWLTNGGYALAAREPAQFVGVGVPGTDQLQDMVLSASFQKTGGPIGGGYGLIVRDQGPGPRDGRNQLGRFYVFGVGDKGEIGVWLRELDRWVDLLSWTPSEAVRPGTATNELTVSAIGDQLSFLVNSIPVASQLDTVLHGGSVGLFTGGDGNEVAVDRVTVRVPR